MKNKLFYKTFLSFVLILFFLTIISVTVLLNFFKNVYISNLEENFKDTSILINENIKIYVESNKFDEIDEYVKTISKNLNYKITIIKSDGIVIADSEKPPSEMENHINYTEIQQALQNETGKSIRYNVTVKEEMLYFAKKITLEKPNTYYFIRTSFYLKNVNSGLANLRNKTFLIAIFVFIFLMVLGYFYSRSLYKAVEDLKTATIKIAKGDFEHKVILYKNNEFKDLANNFNLMVDEIKKLFIQLKEKQEQFKIIISSIDEGVMVIEESGKIIFVNNRFDEFVNNKCVESKFYWEFLLPPEIIRIIENTKNNKCAIFENIEIKTRDFLCHTDYLKDHKQIIIILYDVSKIKELEKFKKDLVANVSHEIKTPLTAIKGFIETAMEETKDKKILHYLNIINDNTTRLINIVSDLLILSSLEQKDRKVEINKVNILEMLKDVEKLFTKKLKEKNLILNIINNNVVNIFADTFMMEQLFINLLDNAVKYTDKGEIRITIYRKDDAHIIIEISDTGIGIPEEHIARIFDRFYVVDKSRSRETGGTGLGLSIVKHIVNLHNGEIIVDSKPGHGTKFLIILPDIKI